MAFTPVEPAARRECHHNCLDTQEKLVSSPFPSWLWVGWLKMVSMSSMALSITNGILGLQFYYFDEQGDPKRVDTPATHDDTFYQGIQQQIRYPPGAVHTWMDKSRQIINPANTPAAILTQRDLMPSLLCFWTSVAQLKVEQRGWDNYHNEPRVIMSQGSMEFAGLWGRIENLVTPEYGLFNVIGAAKLRMSHGGHLTLKLLLVEIYDLNSLLYRRKHLITEVRESDWE